MTFSLCFISPVLIPSLGQMSLYFSLLYLSPLWEDFQLVLSLRTRLHVQSPNATVHHRADHLVSFSIYPYLTFVSMQ